ncbi:MAG: oxalate/formate MFS antiporter [Vicinamibacteria bacterium]
METKAPTVDRWHQLLACVIAMMAIANLQYAWTLFTLPLSESLNARLSDVQFAFTLFVLVQTWLGPFQGALIDRVGTRVVVSVGAILVGLGWIGSGISSSLTQLYLWYGIGGIGAGAVYASSIGTALKWFPDRRGLAAGLTAGAYGFGTALTILPIQWMIESSGYRSTFIVWGILQGVLVLVAAQFLRKPPADGQVPTDAAKPTRVIQNARNYTPGQMVRTGTFWLMYLMMTMVAFGGLMVTAQIKPIAATYGMDEHVVVFGVTALSLAMIFNGLLNGATRPFWGYISDHIGRYQTMGIAFALEAAGIFALLNLIEHPLWFVILSGLVFFAWGEIYSLFPAAIGDVFGPKYATTNYGIQYTAKGTASIFASWGAAWLVETAGTWEHVFWVAVVCDLLAAGLAFFWLRPLAQRLALGRDQGVAVKAPSAATAT